MIPAISALFRIRLALLNGVSALGGYLLFTGGAMHGPALAVFLGVTFLAASGSAFNQLMEQDIDLLMERTRLRPLPTGLFTQGMVVTLGITTAIFGMAILVMFTGPVSSTVAALALAIYLGIYTPLKRHTPLVLAAGAVSGALPPMVGYCAAGGWPTDPPVVLLAGLYYLWQIPHFMLLQNRHCADYKRARLPLIIPGDNTRWFRGNIALWVVALMCATTLLPATGMVRGETAVLYVLLPLLMVFLVMLRSATVVYSVLNMFPLFITLSFAIHR